jgi:hypothetical protein
MIANVFPIFREKGKIIGGTKGNKVLDYISGAPVKERVIDRVPNVFDYDELTKYGCSVSSVPFVHQIQTGVQVNLCRLTPYYLYFNFISVH